MKKEEESEKVGVTRRDFLSATALAGAGLGTGALGIAPAFAAKQGQAGTVELGELDDYYGFWSGGHSGEVRILGLPSMRELMRIPVFNVESATGWGLTNESKQILAGGGGPYLNGDAHHPHMSMTDGRYDGKYVFIKNVNPDYPTRMRGVVEKCNFCAERLAVGELPACVEVSDGALAFGDLYDPESEVRQLIKENYTIRRKQTLGTEPSVYYIV